MLYDDWQGLIRVVVVGAAAYAALIVLLRASGKRTLAKLNAFDFIVTVALGSTLATVLLSSTVALAEGIMALAVLIGLQYVVAWSSIRSRAVEAAGQVGADAGIPRRVPAWRHAPATGHRRRAAPSSPRAGPRRPRRGRRHRLGDRRQPQRPGRRTARILWAPMTRCLLETSPRRCQAVDRTSGVLRSAFARMA